MKLYRIHNWNEWFENSRSRKVADLDWVPIPNRHDGECYSSVIAHPDGAQIYAAWILMLQVASKCHQRGSLVRDNKKPHTPATLALKTRAPQKWFELAIEYLCKETDWLECEEVEEECHADTTTIPPNYQSGDEERRERREGKEEKEPGGVVDVQNRLGSLFQRTPNSRWSYVEETALSELLKRDGFESEISEIQCGYQKRVPFLPQSLTRLLDDWTAALDKIRNFKPVAGSPSGRPLKRWQIQKEIDRIEDELAAQRKRRKKWVDQFKVEHSTNELLPDAKDKIANLEQQRENLKQQLLTAEE